MKEDKRIKMMILAAFISAAAMIAGCTGPDTLARDYGTSYNNAKFGQILNPEAEKNLEPVYGMNGAAAQIVVEKYLRGFEKGPAASPVPGYAVGPGNSSYQGSANGTQAR